MIWQKLSRIFGGKQVLDNSIGMVAYMDSVGFDPKEVKFQEDIRAVFPRMAGGTLRGGGLAPSKRKIPVGLWKSHRAFSFPRPL